MTMRQLTMTIRQDRLYTQKRQLYQYMSRPSIMRTQIRLWSSTILSDSLSVFVCMMIRQLTMTFR